MTPEELLKDQALFELCMKEAEEKVRAGTDPEQARIEVFKAHGVQFDEDAVQSKLVGKMELSEDELRNVNGGVEWCHLDYSCFTVYKITDIGEGFACQFTHDCITVYHH